MHNSTIFHLRAARLWSCLCGSQDKAARLNVPLGFWVFPGDVLSGRLFFFFVHPALRSPRDHANLPLRMEDKTESKPAIIGKALALECAKAADDIQAEQIRVWDMREISSITDYMVVCSASSMPHLRAVLRDIARHITDEHGVRPVNKEGNAEARWVVLDFIDVMVHVMHSEMRDFYGLESLWADAVEIEWESASPQATGA